MKTQIQKLFLALLLGNATQAAYAQGTAFTYQGRLSDNGSPANGNYDLQFYLRDAPASGNPVGSTNTMAPVPVSNGLFIVTLDFGAGVFTGPPRWLEIGVRTNGTAAAHFTLSPRQALTPSPYAIYARTASNVVNGSVVTSLNNLKDNVTLAAGANVTITPNGNTLTLASAGGSSLWNLNGADTYYNAGNVGIGTTTPASKLTVTGSGYGLEHNNGTVRLGTYVDSSGGWLGTRSNDKLKFFVNNGVQPSMTVDTTGNVGIGTTTPTAKLEVVAQDALRLIGYQPFLTLSDANAGYARSRIQTAGGAMILAPESYLNGSNPNALVVIANSGNVGVGTAAPVAKLHAETSLANTAAVYGNATGAGGVGVYGQSVAGPAVHAEGHATQAYDKGGFVKAMVYVQFDGSIIDSYNGVNNTPITVTKPLTGVYRINFGFPVSSRFVSVTAEYNSIGGFSGNRNAGANYRFFDSTSVEVFTFQTDDAYDTTDARFMIVMY